MNLLKIMILVVGFAQQKRERTTRGIKRTIKSTNEIFFVPFEQESRILRDGSYSTFVDFGFPDRLPRHVSVDCTNNAMAAVTARLW